mgnify:FL=1
MKAVLIDTTGKRIGIYEDTSSEYTRADAERLMQTVISELQIGGFESVSGFVPTKQALHAYARGRELTIGQTRYYGTTAATDTKQEKQS